MSEKFGLDWKEHSSQRMEVFFSIMQLQAERDERNAKKNKSAKKR